MADRQPMDRELAGILGHDAVDVSPEGLAAHQVDGVTPRAVVSPQNIRQVAEVVRYANERGLAMVPWGGGTKMSMGHVPQRLDLVVCTRRMNHMIDVDTANLTLTVEAGVKFRDIQARLATEEDRCYLPLADLSTSAGEFVCSDREHKGSFLPMDPPFGDRCTIGGIIAANAAGPRRLLYGNPPGRHHRGALRPPPPARSWAWGARPSKTFPATTCPKLMVGAMGSLGILCEMTLRLLPLPECMETLVVEFETLADARGFADAVLATQLLPAAVEVMKPAGLVHDSQRRPAGPGGGPTWRPWPWRPLTRPWSG